MKFHSSSGRIVRYNAHCVDDYWSRAAPLRVCNAVRDNVVVQCAETSKYLVWPEVSLEKLFAGSTLAYRCPHRRTVTGLEFDMS